MRPARTTTTLALSCALVLGLVLVTVNRAEEPGALAVSDAWVRAPILPGRPAALYFTVENGSDAADRLVRITAEAAGWAEIHTHREDDGVMRMRKLDSLEIPAGKTVTFAPGGHHVMIFEPDESVTPGNTLAATLYFKKAGAVEIEAEIRPLNSR